MRKKLLVFTSTFPRWKNDTIPPFVYELSKRLAKEFDVSVLTPNYPGAKKYEVIDGMKIHRFRYFFEKYETLAGSGGILPTLKKSKWNYFKIPFFMLGEFFALKKQIKENRPDVIHAHWIIPQGFIAAICKKLYGAEYVVTSHGSDIMGLKGFTWMKRFALSNAKKVTVVSKFLKEEIKKIDSGIRVEVIPMGVDTELFNSIKRTPMIKRQYEVKGKLLLYVGRLAPEKGIDLLIDAMPEVVKEYPDIKLLVIGDGTLREDLEGRVKELKIDQNVIFVGWVDNRDLPKYYATADVFVCPSRREGLGLTFVEAGLCGCWLIGTNEGGISDVIQDKNNGVFVKKEDAKYLARKLIVSFSMDQNKKSRDFLVENFELKNISERYARVLR